MESTKQNQKSILRSIDKKISVLKEFIYQLKDNQTLLTIEADREALINACNSLEKYEEISNQLYNSWLFLRGLSSPLWRTQKPSLVNLTFRTTMESKKNQIKKAFDKAINKDAINKLDLKTLRKLDKILSKINY